MLPVETRWSLRYRNPKPEPWSMLHVAWEFGERAGMVRDPVRQHAMTRHRKRLAETCRNVRTLAAPPLVGRDSISGPDYYPAAPCRTHSLETITPSGGAGHPAAPGGGWGSRWFALVCAGLRDAARRCETPDGDAKWRESVREASRA